MRFREFLEEAPDAFFACDEEGRITDVNREACVSLGYSREELLERRITDIDPDFEISPRAPSGRGVRHFGRHRRKDGSFFPVEAHIGTAAEGNRKTMLVLAHDISGRRQAEARQERLTRAYRAIVEINQAIVRMEEEEKLFPQVCRIAVEFGGMRMAWVGRMNEASGRFEPVASYGTGTAYLDGIFISGRSEVPEGRGPSGTAYRENRSVIVNALRSDPSMQPWSKKAAEYGFESCGSFPIFRGKRPFAVFTVYDGHPDIFGGEMVELLDELARDVSFALDNFDRERERKSAEEAVRMSEEKFSKIFRNSPNPTSITRLEDGKFIDVNEAWERITGHSRENAIGRTAASLGIWENPEDRIEAVKALREGGRIAGKEFVFRSRDGEEIICLVSAETVEIEKERCIILIAQDITDLKRAMETIREQNNFLTAIFESEPHCVQVIALDGKIDRMNRAGFSLFEIDDAASDIPIGQFVHPDYRNAFSEFFRNISSGNSGSMELSITGNKGSKRWVEFHATPLRDGKGEVVDLLAVTRDVTDKKTSDELIWKQANFDLLTGLPNRYMFYDRLRQEIRKAQRDAELLALLYIDLDQFKEVNDTLGHQAGDMLLVEAARRIGECVRDSDTVARIGGDEFTVILANLHDGEIHIEGTAQHILDRLSRPFALDDDQIYVSASIGITLYPYDASSVEPLLRNADQAMYAAKNSGRNRYSYFTSAMQEKAQSRLRLLNDLRGALEASQFVLYFQPVVDLFSGHIFKAEALLRWMHPDRGMVGPMEFIPLAEETGLIAEIGDWVFREAAHWTGIWAARHPEVKISVNISPLQFRSRGGNVGAWIEHLEALGLSGGNMIIEITENLLLDADTEVGDKLLRLRDAGIQVAIDDFGTGYSALSYLKKFDIDYLKIDQTFVRNLAVDPDDMALVQAIIVMAHRLDLRVIAEGVETEAQIELLRENGCDYAQGYLFSKPIPAEEFGNCLGRAYFKAP